MKKIKTSNSNSIYVSVDDEDFETLNKYIWHTSWDKNVKNYYVKRHFLKKENKKGTTTIHRVILNAPKGMCVDHINGNTLDNRRSNLRLVTNKQNSWNFRKFSNNTTGYKGVSFCKEKKKFQSYIRVSGKQIHLGFFDIASEAAFVYNSAANKYFGEFARLNLV